MYIYNIADVRVSFSNFLSDNISEYDNRQSVGGAYTSVRRRSQPVTFFVFFILFQTNGLLYEIAMLYEPLKTYNIYALKLYVCSDPASPGIKCIMLFKKKKK